MKQHKKCKRKACGRTFYRSSTISDGGWDAKEYCATRCQQIAYYDRHKQPPKDKAEPLKVSPMFDHFLYRHPVP